MIAGTKSTYGNPGGRQYKPYAVIGNWEYWLVGDNVYLNQVGNRGPMEAGKPSNARWESEKWHFDMFRGMMLEDEAKKYNPAESGSQYRLAQAVLSGASSAMPMGVAREIVDKTPRRLRSEYMQRNPKQLYLDVSKELSKTPPGNDGIARGPWQLIMSGTPVKVLQKGKGRGMKDRVLIEATYYGDKLWGWVDKGILTYSYGNPGEGMEEAAGVFEEFHGYPSSGELELAEHEHYRAQLAELGSLEELEICIDGTNKVVPIAFDHHTKVCCTPDKKQIYLLGGNQELDLDTLCQMGVIDEAEAEKDMVAIGPIHSISYFAKKTHLQGPKEAVPYIHEFGEEKGGVYPELVYDRLNKRCSLAGGSYTVEDVGIKN